MNAAAAGPGQVLDWIDPAEALAAFADETGTLLLSGGPHSKSFLFPGPARRVPLGGVRAAAASGDRIAGLFEYEASAAFEERAQAESAASVHLFAYPAWLCFDPEARRVTLEGQPEAARDLAERLQAAPLPGEANRPGGSFEPVWPKPRYLAACRAILDHIRAGDIYQTNLSQPFAGRLGPGDTPLALFRRLSAGSPAPYGAFLRLSADRVVVTNSPERFLRLADGVAETRPIKGTRPRGAAPDEDARLAAELGASAKDRAENLMIVDLMRNDLSRVCEAGSVRVPELFKVETYANVHHLVSTVTGRMAQGRDALDLVAAAFPPGSITGTPKLRAMEILGAQEGEPRGAYCGAIGWIGDAAQSMDLNVMIRTLTLDRDGEGWRVSGRSGGAITIDSDPEDEYAETLAKASALKRAVTG